MTSANNVTIVFSGTDNVGISGFECSLDSAAFDSSCSSPLKLTSLGEGTHTFQVRAVDSAGNRDGSPDSRSWKVDTIAPLKPTVTSPANNTSTSNNKPTFSGTAEASSLISIYDGTNTTPIGTATTTAGGSWSFTPTTALSQGLHTIKIKAKDAAGNTGQATILLITIDTTAPLKPTITSPVTGSTTNNNKPTISGTAELSSTVLIFDGSTPYGTTTAASTGTGAWSFTPSPTSTALTDGSHTFTAKAKDAAGNTGPASTAVIVTIDTIAPPKPTITSPVTGTTTNNNKPTI